MHYIRRHCYRENEPINVCFHADICTEFFERMVNSPVSSSSNQQSLRINKALVTIYSDSLKLLNELRQMATHATPMEDPVNSSSFPSSNVLNESSLPSNEDSTKVESLCSAISKSYNRHFESPLNMLEDLILITSYLLTNQECYKIRDSSSKLPSSPLESLISVAPYWGIVSIILNQQLGPSETSDLLIDSISVLLSTRSTVKATEDLSECLVARFNTLLASTSLSNYLSDLYSRLRNALKIHLRNPLFLAIHLSISFHGVLTSKYSKNEFPLENLDMFELKGSSLVKGIINTCPLMILSTDLSETRSSILDYVVSYSCEDSVKPDHLQYRYTLVLVKLICSQCPSVLSLADRNGEYPLHYVARRGHSQILSYLSKSYSFTVPLKDLSGKYALHHALLNWKRHSEEVLVELAKIYPLLLLDPNGTNDSLTLKTQAFRPLLFVSKNCPKSLYSQMMGVLDQYNQLRLFQLQSQNLFNNKDRRIITSNQQPKTNAMLKQFMLLQQNKEFFSNKSIDSEESEIDSLSSDDKKHSRDSDDFEEEDVAPPTKFPKVPPPPVNKASDSLMLLCSIAVEEYNKNTPSKD